MTKRDLKGLLREKTGCVIQHTGWPCGTCFFSITEELTERDWQTVLWFRGDYKIGELNNIAHSKIARIAQLKRVEEILLK